MNRNRVQVLTYSICAAKVVVFAGLLALSSYGVTDKVLTTANYPDQLMTALSGLSGLALVASSNVISMLLEPTGIHLAYALIALVWAGALIEEFGGKSMLAMVYFGCCMAGLVAHLFFDGQTSFLLMSPGALRGLSAVLIGLLATGRIPMEWWWKNLLIIMAGVLPAQEIWNLHSNWSEFSYFWAIYFPYVFALVISGVIITRTRPAT
jgi:hypothetical protein